MLSLRIKLIFALCINPNIYIYSLCMGKINIMVSLHYIIATYSGIYRTFETKQYLLQKQLQQLYKILKSKKNQQLECLLCQVTIVCPKVKSGHTECVKYYQKELWKYVFEKDFPHVKLVYLDYVGANEDHSYDQWIQGYLKYSNYDYHLVMEDDYCFDSNKIMFDKDFINMYIEKFPDNVGYLSTWATAVSGHKFHAAISNGLISRKTFEKLENPLGIYYTMWRVELFPQLRFSYMFTMHNIPISDITDKYQALFWITETSEKVCFTPPTIRDSLIYPVQMIGVDTGQNPKRKRRIAFLIENPTDITYDYACFNEILSDNESVFVVQKDFVYDIQKFKNTFPVYEFEKDSLDIVLQRENCDALYTNKTAEFEKVL